MASKCYGAFAGLVSLAIIATAPASADPTGATPGAKVGVSVPGVMAVRTKLLTTFLASNNPSMTIPPGYTTLYSKTIQCVSSTTCTFVMSMMDQIGLCASGAEWGIAVTVDGVLLNNQGQGQGPVSDYVVGNWQGFVPGLAPGNHTVAFQTYVSQSCSQFLWSVNFSTAKP
jgi:hypothetical protein